MRTLATLALVALTACSSSKSAAPALTGDANKDANAFMLAFADAVIGGGSDCEQIATRLEALEPQAKALHEELAKAGKKMGDLTPDPALAQKMSALKDPEILDKCEKASPRANKALDQTLLVVAPITDDPELVKAFGDALGAAAATK